MPDSLAQLRELSRPFSTHEALSSGLTRMAIARHLQKGVLERPIRGVYRFSDLQADARGVLAYLAVASPHAVFVTLSAADLHGLTETNVAQVYMALPADQRPPAAETLAETINCYRWRNKADLTVGVEQHFVEGVEIRVTTPERTVVDIFRYSQYGPKSQAELTYDNEVVQVALNRYLNSNLANARNLRQVALEFKVWDRLSLALETIESMRSRGDVN